MWLVRTASITGNPNDMLGTNVPSITSQCSQSASLRFIMSMSARRLAKLAESMDGETIVGIGKLRL